MNLSLLNINQIILITFNWYASKHNGSSKCENFERTKNIFAARHPFSF